MKIILYIGIVLLLFLSFSSEYNFYEDQQGKAIYGHWAILKNDRDDVVYQELYIDTTHTYLYASDVEDFVINDSSCVHNNRLYIYPKSEYVDDGYYPYDLSMDDTLKLHYMQGYVYYIRMNEKDTLISDFIEDPKMSLDDFIKAVRNRKKIFEGN